MRYYVILILVCSSFSSIAQNEFNVWCFGYGCGLDFNTPGPGVTTSSVLTTEGSAGICNSIGQLLFYSDGVTVWDRNGIPMPNGTGLFGSSSSTQSALICPVPGDTSRYYIFTSDQGGYVGLNRGVHYSIVDMNLNAGMGDVTTKNVLVLGPPATEKLTAVRHCNGTDFWIIIHPFNSDAFNCYLLSATGFNSTPVVSNVGSIHTLVSSNYQETIGYLKASPDSKHLAIANFAQRFAECFDFDANTGVISNPCTINYPVGEYPYGVSFSPNSNLFYISTSGNPTGASAIYQYDISSGVPSTIVASELLLYQASGQQGVITGLQLGPDSKLYVAKNGGAALDRIDFPDVQGLGCGYVSPAITVSGSSSCGLPNCIDAFSGHCTDSTVVPPVDEPVIIPNVFTPNGDGINDTFLITINSATEYNLYVYSRWGNLLFTSNDQNKGWDGTTNNRPVSDGTYYWTLNYLTATGPLVRKSGFVQLIR